MKLSTRNPPGVVGSLDCHFLQLPPPNKEENTYTAITELCEWMVSSALITAWRKNLNFYSGFNTLGDQNLAELEGHSQIQNYRFTKRGWKLLLITAKILPANNTQLHDIVDLSK